MSQRLTCVFTNATADKRAVFGPTTRRCLVVAWSRSLEGNADSCADQVHADQVQWSGSPGNRTLNLRIKSLADDTFRDQLIRPKTDSDQDV